MDFLGIFVKGIIVEYVLDLKAQQSIFQIILSRLLGRGRRKRRLKPWQREYNEYLPSPITLLHPSHGLTYTDTAPVTITCLALLYNKWVTLVSLIEMSIFTDIESTNKALIYTSFDLSKITLHHSFFKSYDQRMVGYHTFFVVRLFYTISVKQYFIRINKHRIHNSSSR